MSRNWVLQLVTAAVVVSLASAGCVHNIGQRPIKGAAAAEEAAGSCELDERLLGVWRNVRSSQLGSAKMRFRFGCDCSYETRITLFWGLFRAKESGPIRTAEQAIVFGRVRGREPNSDYETAWPYEFVGSDLLLSEGDEQAHRYRKVADVRPCERH